MGLLHTRKTWLMACAAIMAAHGAAAQDAATDTNTNADKKKGRVTLLERLVVGAGKEKVAAAFKIITADPKVEGILVNIFGGIMKCDTIATGVITACKATNLNVPLVVRMKGTNEDLGKKMLAESGLPIISVDTMAEAAQAAVKAVKG